MPFKYERSVLEANINIPLLNAIIAFVLDTAKTAYAQKSQLQKRCILLYQDSCSDMFQETYGFLYLGELLERYEERFGMSIQDRRAIALALGYTEDILTSEMFVGNQLNAFLQNLLRYADGDIYLMSALYLLNEGQSGETAWLEQLYGYSYDKTEDILFVMSILQDFSLAFTHFKPQLLRLLGSARTMTVVGNRQLLAWIIAKLQPVVKSMRGKDVAIFRALCALPVSFVKRGSRPHSILLEYGYTPLEIVYLNIGVIQYHATSDTLHSDSIVTEKIVIDLFDQVLNQEASLTQEMYHELSDLLSAYEKFPIRCYGHSKLLEALSEGILIQNAETFAWFSKYAELEHPAFSAFDIMDARWDALANSLSEEKHLVLFERCLTQKMDKQAILERIARFDALTGKRYLSLYQGDQVRCQKFSLLVETGVIDLWDVFQENIDTEGIICAPRMMNYIKSYLRGIKTVQAFQFYQKFLPQYGFDGYQEYLSPQNGDFISGLVQLNGYTGCERVMSISLEQDYLKGNTSGAATILQWLEEYLFRYKPSAYLSFVCKLLLNESIVELLPPGNQRALFDLIVTWPDLESRHLATLRKRYWTAEEWAAEEAAQTAIAFAAEKKRKAQQTQRIRDLYERKADGTIQSLFNFLETPGKDSEEGVIIHKITLEQLPQLLHEKDYRLGNQDAICFLKVCLQLTELGLMSFTEIQNYTSKIKEVSAHGTGDDAEHPSVQ